MKRRTYTAEEIVSYYAPSDLPPNFSSFGPVGNNRPDFKPLRMDNLNNITNITNINNNNNKNDNDAQFVPIARANSDVTSNWEPHMIPSKSPLTTFSSSSAINNMQKHQPSISPPDQNAQAFGSSSFQPDFPSVLAPPTNEQISLNEQQQSQLHQQASSLPSTTTIPQQTQQQQQQQQQQPPQYPFMYLPTQFYPFVNGPQTFAVYSQYTQPPQFPPASYGRPPPQPPYSQQFTYVNQPVMPQLLQTDQMNLGMPTQPQPQPQLQQQPHSVDLSFNPQPLGSQFLGQSSQQQGMDTDQSQYGQQLHPIPQSIQPNNNDFDDSDDHYEKLMAEDLAFPSIVSQAAPDEESFGSVLHPQQSPPQHSVDKAFNPSRLPFSSNMSDIQQHQSQQQQSGSNDSLGFPSVIQDQDEFSPVIGNGFRTMEIQQNPASSFPSVMAQNDANEPSFPSFVPQPPQVGSNSSLTQSSIDSNAADSGFSSVINNPDQAMQQGFPSIIDNQQPFASSQMPNQSFNSMFSNNNSGFPSVVSQQQPQQNSQQMKNSSDNIGNSSFSPMNINNQQFPTQGFDNSGFPSIFEISNKQQDEFSSVIKPQPQQQVQQIEPAVFTFQPKKAYSMSSSVPPKDTFNPRPIIPHQTQPQTQTPILQPPSSYQPPTLHPPTLHPPTFQPPTLQSPTLQPPTLQPPTLQPPTLQQPQLEKNPSIKAPTFHPQRILDPLHSKSKALIRSNSVPVRNQNDQPIMPNILTGAPQFQPQPQIQMPPPPPQLQQHPMQSQIPQPPPQQPVFQPQPQLHDVVSQHLQEKALQNSVELPKEMVADSSMKKFQAKPFNAIEVEEQKKPEMASNEQIHQLQQQQQPNKRQPKQIRKRDLPGPPFDPKPIANQFYYSPTPTPDMNIAIKPRKDTFIGRRRVW